MLRVLALFLLAIQWQCCAALPQQQPHGSTLHNLLKASSLTFTDDKGARHGWNKPSIASALHNRVKRRLQEASADTLARSQSSSKSVVDLVIASSQDSASAATVATAATATAPGRATLAIELQATLFPTPGGEGDNLKAKTYRSLAGLPDTTIGNAGALKRGVAARHDTELPASGRRSVQAAVHHRKLEQAADLADPIVYAGPFDDLQSIADKLVGWALSHNPSAQGAACTIQCEDTVGSGASKCDIQFSITFSDASDAKTVMAQVDTDPLPVLSAMQLKDAAPSVADGQPGQMDVVSTALWLEAVDV